MATIAAAIIGAGATYYAGRQANKRSKRQRQMEDVMANNAQLSGDYGARMLGRSEEALAPVYEHFKRLGTGDRQKLMEYFKPDIERQSMMSRQAFQNAAEFSPRSGIATERNSRIPIDNAASIANMLNSGRAEGIRGLGTLGTNWGQMGMAGLGQGAEGAGQYLGYESNRRRDASAAGAGAGEAAYALFRLFQDAQTGKPKNDGSNASWNPDYMNFWQSGTGR